MRPLPPTALRACSKPAESRGDMAHLLKVLGDAVPAPRVLGGPDDPFRMLVCQMEGDQYMGKLVLGRCVQTRAARRAHVPAR